MSKATKLPLEAQTRRPETDIWTEEKETWIPKELTKALNVAVKYLQLPRAVVLKL